MAAIASHDNQSRRERWKTMYRYRRVVSHSHEGRAETWRWMLAGLMVFWGLAAYGIHSL